MANAAGGNAIDLTPGKTLVKYIDQLNSKLLLTDSSTTGVASDGLGGADSDMMLEHNELSGLAPTRLARGHNPANLWSKLV